MTETHPLLPPTHHKPPLQPLRLSVFFPCRNEVDQVATVTQEVLRAARPLADTLEVLIVDDGSTDGTSARADQLAAEEPEVRVIHHAQNQGYGAALQTGFRETTLDWVWYLDGDGQFEPQDLPAALALLGTHDLVSGVRRHRQDTWWRRCKGRAWSWLVRRLLGLPVEDVDGAFKIYPRPFLEAHSFQCHSVTLDAEMLLHAHRDGLSIGQWAIRHRPRRTGQSHMGHPLILLHALRDLWRLRRDVADRRPPDP